MTWTSYNAWLSQRLPWQVRVCQMHKHTDAEHAPKHISPTPHESVIFVCSDFGGWLTECSIPIPEWSRKHVVVSRVQGLTVDTGLQDGYRMWSPLQKAGSLQVLL